MDKSAVFIDGGYFRRVLTDVFNNRRIDYEKFSDKLCEGTERLRTYYYDCMPLQGSPPTPEEAKRYSAMDKFISYLRKCKRFEVRLGKLIHIPSIGKHIQKRTDVMLAVDLVRMSLTPVNRIQKAILVTGDSDFVPAINIAKLEGSVLTVLYYSRGHPSVYAHDELLDACDETIEITQELIDSVSI